MQPTGPILPGLPTQALATTEASINNWRVGQVLQATSLSTTSAGTTLLQIGKQQIEAHGSHHIKTGQPLKLLVIESGTSPLLKIISNTNNNPVQDATRIALPRQDSIAPLIANLAQIINKKMPDIPTTVRAAIQNLLSKLPSVNQASTAKGLHQAILNNGSLLEAKLLQSQHPILQGRNQEPIAADTKANLIQLLQTLKNWAKVIPKVPQQTNTALNKPTTQTKSPLISAQTVLSKPTSLNVATTSNTVTTPAPSTSTPANTTATPVPSTPTPANTTATPAASTPTPANTTATSTPNASVIKTVVISNTADSTLLNSTSTITKPNTITTGTLQTPASLKANTNPPAPPLLGITLQAQAQAKPNIPQLNNLPLVQMQLEQQVESAVARIQLQQLASIPQGVERHTEWLIELPLQKNNETDLWSIRIKEDENNTEHKHTEKKHWSINLAFNLPKLGPIHVRVTLNNDKISTHFLAEHRNSESILSQYLYKLRQQFERVGLEAGELSCQHGVNKPQNTNPTTNQPLVDEQA